MARFVPKSLADEDWKQLLPNRTHAFLANPENTVYLRLGQGKSLYLELSPSQMGGRVVNTIAYDSGELSLMHKLANLSSLQVGRTSECAVKIISPIVSRLHVELSLDGNVLTVKDLGSSNGTYYHPECFGFDIDPYLASRPVESVEERTLDSIHEVFGPTLDDFLKRYSQKKDALS